MRAHKLTQPVARQAKADMDADEIKRPTSALSRVQELRIVAETGEANTD